MVDIGCGSGTWASTYRKSGIRILGVDGENIRDDQLLIDRSDFVRRDLTHPFQISDRFDLVNCLEVAEHLHSDKASTFVLELTKLADVVVFSAAVPGQGGTHHVNEQWPSYWINLFSTFGFKALDRRFSR